MQTLKIKCLFLCLTFFAVGINAQPQTPSELFPACKKRDKCGYIDQTGKFIIEPKFAKAGEFSEGLANVNFKEGDTQKKGFIDKTGNVVFEHTFLYVLDFSDGLARFRKDEKSFDSGFIDRTGKVVIEPILGSVSDFHEGLAKISVEQEINLNSAATDKKVYKSCFINKKGDIVIPCNFDEASDFSDGFAVAFINKRAGFIDKKGEWFVKNIFVDAKPFSEGLAAVEGIDNNGKRGWGFINTNADVVIGPQYADVSSFSEGLAAVQFAQYGKYGYIGQKGKVIIPFKFPRKPADFSEGFADVYIKGGEYDVEYGYIDKTGELISGTTYTYTYPFKNGVAKAGRLNYLKALLLWGVFRQNSSGAEYYINKSGKTIWKGAAQ